jgi:hypothetical protein
VHDIAADEAELALEPLGAEDLAADDRGAEAGCVRLDRVDDGIANVGPKLLYERMFDEGDIAPEFQRRIKAFKAGSSGANCWQNRLATC